MARACGFNCSTANPGCGGTGHLARCWSQGLFYGDFCGVALAVAAGERAALCCGVTPVPKSEGFAVTEGETFAPASAAGVLPGEPAAGAGDAAGAAVGIAISSRRKLLSLELRCA